jgi:ABC-type uncharacterized transport system permease subunit
MKNRPWLKRPVHTAISWYQSSLLPQFVLLAVVTAVLFMVASQIITRSYFNTSLRRAVAAVESDITAVRMILTGLLAGIHPEQLKERLRDTYA